jgi:hypothetical protein
MNHVLCGKFEFAYVTAASLELPALLASLIDELNA